ncbi:MAG: helix-turn-helix domain-containing protein [Nitrospirae bacterium]|nr:helix-turn-helix domain-containing protein [Nitrospirota bacterium]
MNIPPQDYKKYFEILELNPDASLQEIKASYLSLKGFYSNTSIVTDAISYELSEDSIQKVLAEIQEAYEKLAEFFKNTDTEQKYKERQTVTEDDLKRYLADITTFSGPALCKIRERLGIELKDIADFTKIRRQYLEYIELERFDALPAEVYIRGYVIAYARYLSLDTTRVAEDYMARYRAWKMAATVTPHK